MALLEDELLLASWETHWSQPAPFLNGKAPQSASCPRGVISISNDQEPGVGGQGCQPIGKREGASLQCVGCRRGSYTLSWGLLLLLRAFPTPVPSAFFLCPVTNPCPLCQPWPASSWVWLPFVSTSPPFSIPALPGLSTFHGSSPSAESSSSPSACPVSPP